MNWWSNALDEVKIPISCVHSFSHLLSFFFSLIAVASSCMTRLSRSRTASLSSEGNRSRSRTLSQSSESGGGPPGTFTEVTC